VGGAVDFIPKPTVAKDIQNIVDSLIVKVKTAARANFRNRLSSSGKSVQATLPKRPAPSSQIKHGLQPFQSGDPIIVIGSSTGGPRALQQVISNLPGDLSAAVIIVQHMPAGFTRSLAQRLNEASALIVQEANNGDRLARGLVLLAPGDYHLLLRDEKQVKLDHGPRRNHVRPAVDVTMESVVRYHKSAVIGVVLTGMGSDGSAGAGAIKAAGGRIIAEHESTSVVYGMPRSVVEANLADQVIPLPDVASALVELVNNGNMGI
jgi:two-component system chemotaxis response regulator CheB